MNELFKKVLSSLGARVSFCLRASKIEANIPRGDTNGPDIKKRIHQDGFVERSIGRDSVDRWPRTSRESSRFALVPSSEWRKSRRRSHWTMRQCNRSICRSEVNLLECLDERLDRKCVHTFLKETFQFSPADLR